MAWAVLNRPCNQKVKLIFSNIQARRGLQSLDKDRNVAILHRSHCRKPPIWVKRMFSKTTPTNPYSLPSYVYCLRGSGAQVQKITYVTHQKPHQVIWLTRKKKSYIEMQNALLWVGVTRGWWKQTRIHSGHGWMWSNMDRKMCHICPATGGGLNPNISSMCYWQWMWSNLLVGSLFNVMHSIWVNLSRLMKSGFCLQLQLMWETVEMSTKIRLWKLLNILQLSKY